MDIDINKLAEETSRKSMVIIEFESVGSAQCIIYNPNTTPEQLLAAASILELRAKNWYIQQENERMQKQLEQQLAVPKNEILKPK